MYKISNITDYIINFASENNLIITERKLHLILYCIQSKYLFDKDKSFISDYFYRHYNGPYIPTLSARFNHYYQADVQSVPLKLVKNEEGHYEYIQEYELYKNDIVWINEVLPKLLNMDEFYLSIILRNTPAYREFGSSYKFPINTVEYVNEEIGEDWSYISNQMNKLGYSL